MQKIVLSNAHPVSVCSGINHNYMKIIYLISNGLVCFCSSYLGISIDFIVL